MKFEFRGDFLIMLITEICYNFVVSTFFLIKLESVFAQELSQEVKKKCFQSYKIWLVVTQSI